MKRREFVALLGGTVTAWPLAARAQQAARLPTIGFMGESTAAGQQRWVAAFLQRLRELGWLEGRTVAVEYRWAEGRNERFAEIVSDLVRLKVDVIVAQGTPAVLAAKRAASAIPVVFAIAGNPVANGLVATLARPGANVTGLSNLTADIAGRRLELLACQLCVGWPSWPTWIILPWCWTWTRYVRRPTRSASTSPWRKSATPMILRSPSRRRRPGSRRFMLPATRLVTTNRNRIAILAVGARLPTMHGNRENVDAGGLMSYGPSLADLHRRAGDFVDKILRGSKPADIPVEQPTKFDIVLNLTAARALDLDVPSTLLARADEVIE